MQKQIEQILKSKKRTETKLVDIMALITEDRQSAWAKAKTYYAKLLDK